MMSDTSCGLLYVTKNLFYLLLTGELYTLWLIMVTVRSLVSLVSPPWSPPPGGSPSQDSLSLLLLIHLLYRLHPFSFDLQKSLLTPSQSSPLGLDSSGKLSLRSSLTCPSWTHRQSSPQYVSTGTFLLQVNICTSQAQLTQNGGHTLG